MKKIFFILLFPFFLSAKIQVTTYFPLETFIIKKISYNEFQINEITQKYSENYKDLSIPELRKYATSNLYFHFGLDIEKRYFEALKKRNPEIIEIDLSLNIEKIDNNPYIWMDPILMRDISKNIYEALIKYDEEKKELYKKNYEAYLDELDETFLKIKQRLNSSQTNSVYAFDEYWDYFGRRFGIEIIRRDKNLINISQLSEILKYTRNYNIKKLLFSNQADNYLALSFSSNLNIKAIDNNIFQSNWQSIVFDLTNNLSK